MHHPYSPEDARALLSQDAEPIERESPQDIWNSWVGADYTPEWAVAEARERQLSLAAMAAELVLYAAEAHGIALTDTHDSDALMEVFLRVLEGAEMDEGATR